MRVIYACHLNPSTTDLPLLLATAWQQQGVEIQLVTYELDFLQDVPRRLVRRLQYLDPPSHERSFGEIILSNAARFRPDVVLLGNAFLNRSQLARLHRYHRLARLGLFLGYNHLLVGNTVETILAADFLIVHDSYLLSLLQGERYNRKREVYVFPCAADPQEHRPIELTNEDRARFECDVAFIGGHSPNRESLLAGLKNCQLRIWGDAAWSRSNLAECYCPEPVYGLKKTKIYNAAKIVLNLEDNEKQQNAISNRVPEVLACGGFVLTEDRLDLNLTGLQKGRSIDSFRTAEELQEQVHYYLRNSDARRAISAGGRQIVLERLTYDHIARDLLKSISELVSRCNDASGSQSSRRAKTL